MCRNVRVVISSQRKESSLKTQSTRKGHITSCVQVTEKNVGRIGEG